MVSSCWAWFSSSPAAASWGAAYAASQLSGNKPRESGAIAAPVNTRGPTELTALNVGLQAGIISHRLVTVLAVMAFLTTVMTGPLQSAIRPGGATVPAGAMPRLHANQGTSARQAGRK